MALYEYNQFLKHSIHNNFDLKYSPGDRPPDSGIYRCIYCGREESCNKGNPLPPQNHHQHSPPAPITWQLIVCSEG